ncbi:TetR/AcrR family transcriptional regulator [Schumannella luteola]|uniref:AcrR family transcriptional regulator n=1 Tax=Schumannella luteola TaxID=472059 RepID=A0A852Y8C4_9MICO|nr:TetR/AcrR family transcriptional regulator [Schumannella luteola]NYG98643.1 AcrR family transcriptional regulator [Schumannella luteola]TPX02611.1 TetR family transcriptional regulator [Schumannella luteola]
MSDFRDTTAPASDADEPVGLRERKRRATRRAILLAAAQLVKERGLEGATVDEISRLADVSPRTFFNYFASKEEAVSGELPSLPAAEHIQTFVAARGLLLDDLAELVVASVDATLADREVVLLRRELVKVSPQLVAQRMTGMREYELELAGVVAQRLAAQHPETFADAEAAFLRARLLVFSASGALRHAWIAWADHEGDDDLATMVRRAFAALRETIRLEG